MGETIAILIIFFFLVIFGFGFYVRVQQSGFQRQKLEGTNLRAIQVAQKASFLPELQCSFKNVQVDDCIDLIKLDAFGRSLSNSDGSFYQYYSTVFGKSDIRVQMVYPPGPTYIVYTTEVTKPENNLSTFVPVALYNATSKSYSFGILSVNTYE